MNTESWLGVIFMVMTIIILMFGSGAFIYYIDNILSCSP